jgi:hypothetical protein
MPVPQIYADFQNLDDFNRVRLNCTGTLEDLARHKIALRDGLTITFYMDDADDEGHPDELCIDGIVHYEASEKCWVATVDWSKVRHASDDRQGNVNGASSLQANGKKT